MRKWERRNTKGHRQLLEAVSSFNVLIVVRVREMNVFAKTYIAYFK